MRFFIVALLLLGSFCFSAESSNIDKTSQYSEKLSGKSKAHIKKSWTEDNEIMENALKEKAMNGKDGQSVREHIKDMLGISEKKEAN